MRCKPGLSAEANNRRDPFLWTLIRPVNVFSSPATVSVQRQPAAETLLSQCCQFTRHDCRETERWEEERGRERKREERRRQQPGVLPGNTTGFDPPSDRRDVSRPGRLTAAHCASDYWNQINKCHSCSRSCIQTRAKCSRKKNACSFANQKIVATLMYFIYLSSHQDTFLGSKPTQQGFGVGSLRIWSHHFTFTPTLSRHTGRNPSEEEQISTYPLTHR